MIKIVKLSLILALSSSLTYAAKIVSVGGSITETIVALGHKNDLIGVDQSSIYPAEVTKLPSVGYWLTLPQEGILSLQPEVAIISNRAEPKKIVDELPKYGVKTYLIEDEPNIESAKKKIQQVAEILGEEEKAKEIIQRIEKNIAQVKEETKVKKAPKVLFLFSRGEGTVMAAGKETKPGVMIGLAGGENVVSFPQYTKISAESILEMNPDVIIKSNHNGDIGIDKKTISSTNAGKNNQIYSMDMLFISGFTVRIDSALQELSCMFHNKSLSYCK